MDFAANDVAESLGGRLELKEPKVGDRGAKARNNELRAILLTQLLRHVNMPTPLTCRALIRVRQGHACDGGAQEVFAAVTGLQSKMLPLP